MNLLGFAYSPQPTLADPSGQFGLAEMGAADSVASILSSIQIDIGTNLLDAALNPDAGSSSAMLLGVAALGASGFKLFRMLSGKFRIKNLPVVNRIDMAHITGAHMSGPGKVTGYHSRPGGVDFKGWSVKITRKDHKTGVYEGEVFFYDKPKRKGRGMSTFFPDHWSEQQVEAEIMSAYMRSEGGTSWSGVSASGVKIEGYFGNGTITNAYPILR